MTCIFFGMLAAFALEIVALGLGFLWWPVR